MSDTTGRQIAVFCSIGQYCLIAFCIACLLCRSPVGAADNERPVVEVLNETNWDRLVPKGKEVDAIYGDIVMQNSFLRAVIARPTRTRNANMTVRDVGGCLIDLTTRLHESDQLSAFYPGRRANSFEGDPYFAVNGATATVDDIRATTLVGGVKLSVAGTEKTPSLDVTYWLSDHK